MSILIVAKIKDNLINVNKGQLYQYKKLMPNGRNLGIESNYIEQEKPAGLPDAFILGENFCIIPSFGTYNGELNVKSAVLKRVLNNNNRDLIVIVRRNIFKKILNNIST